MVLASSRRSTNARKVQICGISSTTVTTESFLVIQSLSKSMVPHKKYLRITGFPEKIHIKRSVLTFQFLAAYQNRLCCICTPSLNKLNSMKSWIFILQLLCTQIAIRFNTRCGQFLCIFRQYSAVVGLKFLVADSIAFNSGRQLHNPAIQAHCYFRTF